MRTLLVFVCALLVTANTVNIGADLGGMAEVTEMVTGVNRFYWLPIYAVFIASMLIWRLMDRHRARLWMQPRDRREDREAVASRWHIKSHPR